MKSVLPLTFLLAFFWLSAPDAIGAAAKAPHARQWTLQDTISQALNHSPAVKREEEAVKMQRQNVKQAKSGYLPKLDVQASGGVATLPVSRNE